MPSNKLHWGFHTEVLSRSLKDLEAAVKADPKSAEFSFLRSEAQEILAEAAEALVAIESYLTSLEEFSIDALAGRTQH